MATTMPAAHSASTWRLRWQSARWLARLREQDERKLVSAVENFALAFATCLPPMTWQAVLLFSNESTITFNFSFRN
jgi:hypothetical protein